jgi:hypothetical protein
MVHNVLGLCEGADFKINISRDPRLFCFPFSFFVTKISDLALDVC